MKYSKKRKVFITVMMVYGAGLMLWSIVTLDPVLCALAVLALLAAACVKKESEL